MTWTVPKEGHLLVDFPEKYCLEIGFQLDELREFLEWFDNKYPEFKHLSPKPIEQPIKKSIKKAVKSSSPSPCRTYVVSCKYCTKNFKSRSRWTQYCSNICKERYSIESNAKYAGVTVCYYCGATADSIDHIPPLSERHKLFSLGLTFKYKFFEVNACRECNSALGARSLFNLSERKAYIKNYLERKYKKYLNIPYWSERELNDVGYSLRTNIKVALQIQLSIRSRLRW